MKFGVVVFPGTWSDRDCGWVVEQVLQEELVYLWHKDPDLHGADCVILPGGFSYGDYLRAGAIARFAPVMDSVRAFADAFPEAPKVDASNLAKAIATYERTFVSPDTRFDRWIAGDEQALTASEIAGFRLFTGKAQCVKCHSGFTFTDYAFHDIGLPGDDRGRGAVLRLDAAEHAFKTPGLREIGRSAPFMHDGSLATLEDVLRHYVSGIVDRPTLSKDLTRGIRLSDAERADLIAFLGTLTSEKVPALPDKIVPVASSKPHWCQGQ